MIPMPIDSWTLTSAVKCSKGKKLETATNKDVNKVSSETFAKKNEQRTNNDGNILYRYRHILVPIAILMIIAAASYGLAIMNKNAQNLKATAASCCKLRSGTALHHTLRDSWAGSTCWDSHPNTRVQFDKAWISEKNSMVPPWQQWHHFTWCIW